MPKRSLQWKKLQYLQKKPYYFQIAKRIGVMKIFLSYVFNEKSDTKHMVLEIKGLLQTSLFFTC